MNFETQLNGLNDLIRVIYGSEAQLASLLRELGFEQAQVEHLHGAPLEAVAAGLLTALHKRLAGDSGQDTYYPILSSHYGLDGEPPRSLNEIAQERGMDRAYLSQLFREILERCKTKATQEELKKELKRLAAARLAQTSGRPSREHVAAKLERLSNLRGAADVTRLDYEAKRLEILKKVQAELDALDVEYKPLMDTVDENILELENEIRTDVLMHGETVTGGTYRATYSKGRVTWDSGGMEKYAQGHPEVLQFRKEGQPIVALRIITEKD